MNLLRSTAFGWAFLFLAAVVWAEDGKVPLKTEIPEEVLAGTPPEVLALLFPELEKLPEGERPEFLVPEGTVNLARGKKVAASDDDPLLGELSFINDGKKEGSESNYLELSPGSQWIQIDLEKESQIFALYLWHYFREAQLPRRHYPGVGRRQI